MTTTTTMDTTMAIMAITMILISTGTIPIGITRIGIS